MYYQYPYTGYRNIPNGDERFFGFPFVAGLAGGLLGGLAVGGLRLRQELFFLAPLSETFLAEENLRSFLLC